MAREDWQAALQAADNVLQPLSAAEQMWAEVYRGFALDYLGQRDAAAAAYDRAARIHPHPLTKDGARGPIRRLRHIADLRAVLDEGLDVRTARVLTDYGSVAYAALVPLQPRGMHPALIRVGHPNDADAAIHRVLELHRMDAVPREVVVVHTDALISETRALRPLVDAPHLVVKVPPRFAAFIERLPTELPIAKNQIYLFGYSFDGVWAWMLGLDRPELYAGVIALSAVSYPRGISERIDRSARLPICVLRGDCDHMFPRRLDQEKHVGERLMPANPKRLWQLLPNTGHEQVWQHARVCFQRFFGQGGK